MNNKKPTVFIVGAGPGDPELLTLKAARALAFADVVLIDDLVNPAVLAHCPSTVRIIPVGKRGGCVSTPQSFINKLIVKEAQHGNTVVRLKGGDPAIFSRAGEEIAAIVEARLTYEIVPGITSASAAAAACGVPLTDRAAGHGVAFVTGHPAPGAPPVDWAALLASRVTLALYMVVGRAAEIVAALQAAGAAEDVPCAVVANASGENARQLVCTLATLTHRLIAEEIPSPAIVMIGEAMASVALSTVGEHADASGELKRVQKR